VLSRAETSLIRALQQRKARETKGLFLAEGVRVVEELLRSGIDLDFAAVSTSLRTTSADRSSDALEERCAVHELSDRELNAQSATEQPRVCWWSHVYPAPSCVIFRRRSEVQFL
jgi:TrmH family RNA methyltransferase